MIKILSFVSLLFACIFLPSEHSGAEIIISHNSNQQENKIVLNNTGGLKKINLVFQKIFPYIADYDKEDIAGCVKDYTTSGKVRLKCREHISLLRKSMEAKRWLLVKKTTGYINLTIREMGIINVKAYIASIKPVSISTACYMQLSYNSDKMQKISSSSCITGTFKRHVDNVGSYTFKDLSTGKKEILHVTPNHLFYAKNRKGFIAVNQLGPADEMITLSGHRVRLVCPWNKKNNCSAPLEKFNISTVYNMEVHQQHEYFAGGNKIYVHNVYICKYCRKEITGLKQRTEHPDTHDATEQGKNCRLCLEAFQINTTFKRPLGLTSHMKRHFKVLAEESYEEGTMYRIVNAKPGEELFQVREQWLKKMKLQKEAFHKRFPFNCTACSDGIIGYYKHADLLMKHKRVNHNTPFNMATILSANFGPAFSPSVPVVISPGTYELVKPIHKDRTVYKYFYLLPKYTRLPCGPFCMIDYIL